MDFRELVERNRSYRRFARHHPVSMDDLVELVSLARLTPCARNLQALRFVLVADEGKCAEVFPTLGWAGYLPHWNGPDEGERPTGYVVICVDRELTKEDWGDQGIAAQTIMLGAVSMGYGGCMLGSVNREKLSGILEIPPNHEILLVLALGVPAEHVTVEPLPEDGSIKYWRDDKGVHHVPKRDLDELITAKY